MESEWTERNTSNMNGGGVVMQKIHFHTNGSCFVCLNPLGTSQRASYSLGPLCTYINMNMELLRLLANHYDTEVEITVNLCEECGGVVARLTELLHDQDVNPLEYAHYMEAFGGLVLAADGDPLLAMQFKELMTTGHYGRSEFRVEALLAVRTIMAEDCLKLAAELRNPPRVVILPQGNDTPENPVNGLGGEKIPPEGQPIQLHLSDRSDRQVELETAHALLMLHGSAPPPPVAPSRPELCFLCDSCGELFESMEMLSSHVQTTHSGVEAIVSAPSGPASLKTLYPELTRLLQASPSLPQVEDGIQGEKGNQTATGPVQDGNLPQPQPPRSGFDPNSSNGSAVVQFLRMLSSRKVRYECKQCLKRGMGIKALRKHFLDVHGHIIRVPCPLCKRNYAGVRSARRHYMSKHAGIKYQCPHCNRLFSYQDSLRSHMETIHYGRQSKCRYCSKTFSHRSTMYSHMLKTCTKRFPQSTSVYVEDN